MTRQFAFLSLVLLTGCVAEPVKQPAPQPSYDSSRNPEMLTPDLYPTGVESEHDPVVRYGRYTLASTEPNIGQRDLMSQIIDVSIPSSMKPTLKDAMAYVVDRSGYSLCPSAERVNILYTRPLPAAQYKLGPMTLRNTLQVLAGPAWQVKVDEVQRQVCFTLRPGYQLPPVQLGSSAVLAASNAAALRTETHTAPTHADAELSSAVTTPVAVSAPVRPSDSSTTATPAPSATGAVGVTPITKAMVKGTPAPPVAPAPIPLPIWTATRGSTLRTTVETWAKQAHWDVIWQPDDLDYAIAAPLRFEGRFEDAISQLFPLYDGAPRSFKVDASTSQRLVHIAERAK